MGAICIAYCVKSSKSETFCSNLWINSWSLDRVWMEILSQMAQRDML
jgi:hypothetical protein